MRKLCIVQAHRPHPLSLAALFLVGFVGGALAQGAPARTPPRTVTWYADNPQARARVQLACLDDPGHLGSNPDCINAQQASVEVALREARSRTAAMNPNSPAFWAADPEARRSQLIMCRRNPGVDHCGAALRSLQIEAGVAQR